MNSKLLLDLRGRGEALDSGLGGEEANGVERMCWWSTLVVILIDQVNFFVPVDEAS